MVFTSNSKGFHGFQSSLKACFDRTRGPWRTSKACNPYASAAWLTSADGGFLSHGGTRDTAMAGWVIMENPVKMYDLGVPILGNLHISAYE